MDVPPAVPCPPACAMPEAPLPPAPRQRLATASLTLGILGNLGFGPFAGVPAVIAGHLAFARARRMPLTHGGRGTAIAGFVLGYVSFLLGLPVLALLLTAIVPSVQRSRATAEEARCATHLKDLAVQVQQYAETHDGRLPQSLDALGVAASTSSPATGALVCPVTRGGAYRPTRYDLMTPNAAVGETAAKPILRCPAHGHLVTSDGSVLPGKPGVKRRRNAD